MGATMNWKDWLEDLAASQQDWLEDLVASQQASKDCTRDDSYAHTRDSCIVL
jgi:hypothetical protein